MAPSDPATGSPAASDMPADVLSTLRNTELLGDGANLLAALFDWIAAAAVGVGAWMVWRRS